jgi:hypothetical protein
MSLRDSIFKSTSYQLSGFADYRLYISSESFFRKGNPLAVFLKVSWRDFSQSRRPGWSLQQLFQPVDVGLGKCVPCSNFSLAQFLSSITSCSPPFLDSLIFGIGQCSMFRPLLAMGLQRTNPGLVYICCLASKKIPF